MYLLGYAAKTGKRTSASEWSAAARRLPAFIAGTADFDAMAQYLIEHHLATIGDDSIMLGDQLASLGHYADNITLAKIARILLEASKPQWLMTAVCGDTVFAEYLPTDVESNLAWLDQYRDVVLRAARRTADNSDAFRHWLGRLGEEIVFRSELQMGCEVAWMSQLSDAFGYDILSTRNGLKKQIEVKTTIEGSERRFFLSRNEANVAAANLGSWVVVQVVLAKDCSLHDEVTPASLVAMRTLETPYLVDCLPRDTHCGKWIGSTEISPEPHAWKLWPGPSAAHFSLMGWPRAHLLT